MSTACKPDPLCRGGLRSDVLRLEVLKASRDCVVYHDAPLAEDRSWNLSLYGNRRTGELFVELTNGDECRVGGFQSSTPEMSPEERTEGILWPDLVEAFAQARQLHRPTFGIFGR